MFKFGSPRDFLHQQDFQRSLPGGSGEAGHSQVHETLSEQGASVRLVFVPTMNVTVHLQHPAQKCWQTHVVALLGPRRDRLFRAPEGSGFQAWPGFLEWTPSPLVHL